MIKGLMKHSRSDPAIPCMEIDPGDFPLSIGYEHMYIDRDNYVRAAYVDENGVFLFIPVKDELTEKEKHRAVGTKMAFESAVGLYTAVFVFFIGENSVWYGDGFIQIEPSAIKDIYDLAHEGAISPHNALDWPMLSEDTALKDRKIGTCFEFEGAMFTVDESEEPEPEIATVRRKLLDDATVDRLDMTLSGYDNNERPSENYRIMEDGSEWVLKHTVTGGIDLGINAREQWFRLSDHSTDDLIRKAAFGGWFGLHKFVSGETMQGILYALSCGCLGILPAADILAMLCGGAYIMETTYSDDCRERTREKVFLKKPRNKVFAIAGIFIALALGFILINTLYRGLWTAITAGLGGAASSDTVQNIIMQYLTP